MKRTLLGILIFSGLAMAQAPNCSYGWTFTAAASGNAQANQNTTVGGTPCIDFTLDYWISGGAVSGFSITFEGAPDNGSGAPGSFTALTVSTSSGSGSNPLTSLTNGHMHVCCDYYPWIRARVSSFTASSGTPSALVRSYGYIGSSTTGAGGSSGIAANVTVVGPIGQHTAAGSVAVVLASDQPALPSASPCTSQALFNLSGSGNTRIVTGDGVHTIYVCNILFSTTPPENVKLTSGTGAACAGGGGPTDLTGSFQLVSGLGFDPIESFNAGVGLDLCLNQQNAQSLGGVVTYILR